MTKTERFCWTTFAVCVLAMLIAETLAARAQDRVPEVATDWRQLYAAPQSVDLASIAPLEVVHYSWPIRPQDVLPTPAWWLHDYVRITKGASIHAETSTTEAHVRALAKIAAQYRASVAVVMAPYHHASWSDGDPRHVDATYWPWWSARLTLMRSWVESEGASVGMVIFDCERFIIRPIEPAVPGETLAMATARAIRNAPAIEWNAAMRARYNEATGAIETIFGEEMYIEWYARGWYRPIGTSRLQRYAGPYYHFDLTERGDGVSCVLTRPDWTDAAIGSVYETALRSPGATDPIVVWLYLGVGYRLSAGSLSYSGDWDYGDDAARGLARLRDACRGRLRAVVFYPSPGSTPGSLRLFKAYAEAGR